MSSSETRRAMELWAVRSDLMLVELPISVHEGLVGGFLGTVVSGKLPKVKENPAAASIWMLTLAEKKTSDCLSNKSTRGMPSGRFVGEGGFPEPRTRWLRVDARV